MTTNNSNSDIIPTAPPESLMNEASAPPESLMYNQPQPNNNPYYPPQYPPANLYPPQYPPQYPPANLYPPQYPPQYPPANLYPPQYPPTNLYPQQYPSVPYSAARTFQPSYNEPVEEQTTPTAPLEQEEEEKPEQVQEQEQSAPTPQVEEESQESSGVMGMAFDLIMVITKAYAVMVLKFGDTIAKIIIGMILPSQVSDQIINGKPVDVKIITPILTNSIYVLQDPEFRVELTKFFATISERIGPQMTNLLTQVSKIFLDVMTKNATKLVSVITTSMSAFPPAALFFNLTNLASAGVNTFTSGLNLVGVTTTNVAKMASQVSEHAKPLTNKFNELINKNPQPPAQQEQPPTQELSRFKKSVNSNTRKLFGRDNLPVSDSELEELEQKAQEQTNKQQELLKIKQDEFNNRKQLELEKIQKQKETDIENFSKKRDLELEKFNKKKERELENIRNPKSFMQKTQGLFSKNKTIKNNTNMIQTGGHMKTKKIVNRIIKSLNDFKNTDKKIQTHTTRHHKKHKHRTRKHR
jgi:hypothetical protein